ncbi:hypothetical protein MTR67_003343 [Solanum verrucosum]|uniref:Zinc finger PMZ-type domain-containing protein n=1 Tax=Solanum verrucosum TaxID=315347 RepID=A0AAF0PRY8_SOLVR|nr:hypothetical protein MTR67_003343 [Solanum verrucosum]
MYLLLMIYEEIVFDPNIINHSETYHVQCEYGTDTELESDDGLVDPTLDGPGYKLKTFKQEHNCEEALHNPRATTNTLSHYFKSKVQNNPKYALKDMKQDLMDNFNLNTNDSKLKRAKRMALQKMQGSFLDEYNRLEAYENEIRMTNPFSDVVINLSKDAMEQGKIKFLRMYICFNAMKPLAWTVVDKETTSTWTWFLELLEKSLNLKNGDSITFMSDMQKGLLNAVENVLPLSNHSKIAKLCKLEFNGDLGFEVSKGGDRHILTGIPCPHAIKALRYKNIEPRDEISWWYTKEAYLKTYGAKLLPMRGEQFWQVLPEHAMDPPNLVKTVGRPKVKRDREKNAAIKRVGKWSHSRKGTKMTCSKCGSQAHNARSYKASEEGYISILKRKRGRTEGVEQDEEVFDVNSSAPQLTQQGFESDISAPRQRQYEPFGPTRELVNDLVLKPRIIFEELTRLKMR